MDKQIIGKFYHDLNDYYNRLMDRVDTLDHEQEVIQKYSSLFDGDINLVKQDKDTLFAFLKMVYKDSPNLYELAFSLFDEVKYIVLNFENFEMRDKITQFNEAVAFLKRLYDDMYYYYNSLKMHVNSGKREFYMAGIDDASNLLSAMDENGFNDSDVSIDSCMRIFDAFKLMDNVRYNLLLSLYACKNGKQRDKLLIKEKQEEESFIDLSLYMSNSDYELYCKVLELLKVKINYFNHLDDSVKRTMEVLGDNLLNNSELRESIFDSFSNPDDREALFIKDMDNLVKEINDVIGIVSNPMSGDNDEWFNHLSDLIGYLRDDYDKYNKFRDELMNKEEKQEDNLKILYLTTESGYGYLSRTRDLGDIPSEYCASVMDMVDELRKGIFSDNNEKDKKLVSNKKLSGLFEKKRWKVRLFYKRLPDDYILIIGVKMKTESNYMKHIEDRYIKASKRINDLIYHIENNDMEGLLEKNSELGKIFNDDINSKMRRGR